MTFPFVTSKYFYEEAEAFDADEKKLMAEGVAAFGGIAPHLPDRAAGQTHHRLGFPFPADRSADDVQLHAGGR